MIISYHIKKDVFTTLLQLSYHATISEYEEKYYETIIFKYWFLELETSLSMQLTSILFENYSI